MEKLCLSIYLSVHFVNVHEFNFGVNQISAPLYMKFSETAYHTSGNL
jgi:hypothetical protein